MARGTYPRVFLTDEDFAAISAILANPQASKDARRWCRIIIDRDEARESPRSFEETAKLCGCSASTVLDTVRRYLEEGVPGIAAKKRSVNSDNARRKLTEEEMARIAELARGPAPEGQPRWTVRLLTEQGNLFFQNKVGKGAISRILAKENLVITPQKEEVACVSKRPRITDAEAARILELARGPVPEGKSQWTIRRLSDQGSLLCEKPVSPYIIKKILKNANISLIKESAHA